MTLKISRSQVSTQPNPTQPNPIQSNPTQPMDGPVQPITNSETDTGRQQRPRLRIGSRGNNEYILVPANPGPSENGRYNGEKE